MFTAVFCSRVVFDVAERLKLCDSGCRTLLPSCVEQSWARKMLTSWACVRLVLCLISDPMHCWYCGPRLPWQPILGYRLCWRDHARLVLDKPVATEKVRDAVENIFVEDENKSPIQTTLTNVKLEGYDDDRVFKLVTSLKDEICQRSFSKRFRFARHRCKAGYLQRPDKFATQTYRHELGFSIQATTEVRRVPRNDDSSSRSNGAYSNHACGFGNRYGSCTSCRTSSCP